MHYFCWYSLLQLCSIYTPVLGVLTDVWYMVRLLDKETKQFRPPGRPSANSEIVLVMWFLENNAKEECAKRSAIPVKESVMTPEDAIVIEFHDRLFRCIIWWQYGAHRLLRRKKMNKEQWMSKLWKLLHIDYCENYSCTYSQEIRLTLCEGSDQQATLHSRVLYTSSEKCSSSSSPSR